jgi:hypothetical protein
MLQFQQSKAANCLHVTNFHQFVCSIQSVTTVEMAEYTYADMANMHQMFHYVSGKEDKAHSLFQQHF